LGEDVAADVALDVAGLAREARDLRLQLQQKAPTAAEEVKNDINFLLNLPDDLFDAEIVEALAQPDKGDSQVTAARTAWLEFTQTYLDGLRTALRVVEAPTAPAASQ
jgi:hypothetical protein